MAAATTQGANYSTYNLNGTPSSRVPLGRQTPRSPGVPAEASPSRPHPQLAPQPGQRHQRPQRTVTTACTSGPPLESRPPAATPGACTDAAPAGAGTASTAACTDPQPDSAGAVDSLRHVLPPGALPALRGLLGGRKVALLWDLDNVSFFAPRDSAPLQLRRLQALVTASGGELALCRGYANKATRKALAGVLPVLERSGLMSVEVVRTRDDRADMALVTDAMAFGKTHGSAAAVLCVSQDGGFAQLMRHLTELEVVTVAVSQLKPVHPTHAVMYPSTYINRLALPTSCCAAIKWEAKLSPVTGEEARWLRGHTRNGGAAATAPAENRNMAQRAATTPASSDDGSSTSGGNSEGSSSYEACDNGMAAASRSNAGSSPRQGLAKDGGRGGQSSRHVMPGAEAPAALVHSAAALKPPGQKSPRSRVHPNLAVYAQEGQSCPGVVSSVWLNPRYNNR